MVLYKSDKLRDVAFHLLEFHTDYDKKSYELTVEWWNIGRSHAPWNMGIVQKITIPVDKWNKEFYIMPQWQYSGHEYYLGEK